MGFRDLKTRVIRTRTVISLFRASSTAVTLSMRGFLFARRAGSKRSKYAENNRRRRRPTG